jgi:hypothetical protein
MGINFEYAIRAEFATMHLMKEQGLTGPVELHLGKGYALHLSDVAKWNRIQDAYELDIERCLKSGIGDRKSFKYRQLDAT